MLKFPAKLHIILFLLVCSAFSHAAQKKAQLELPVDPYGQKERMPLDPNRFPANDPKLLSSWGDILKKGQPFSIQAVAIDRSGFFKFYYDDPRLKEDDIIATYKIVFNDGNPSVSEVKWNEENPQFGYSTPPFRSESAVPQYPYEMLPPYPPCGYPPYAFFPPMPPYVPFAFSQYPYEMHPTYPSSLPFSPASSQYTVSRRGTSQRMSQKTHHQPVPSAPTEYTDLEQLVKQMGPEKAQLHIRSLISKPSLNQDDLESKLNDLTKLLKLYPSRVPAPVVPELSPTPALAAPETSPVDTPAIIVSSTTSSSVATSSVTAETPAPAALKTSPALPIAPSGFALNEDHFPALPTIAPKPTPLVKTPTQKKKGALLPAPIASSAAAKPRPSSLQTDASSAPSSQPVSHAKGSSGPSSELSKPATRSKKTRQMPASTPSSLQTENESAPTASLTPASPQTPPVHAQKSTAQPGTIKLTPEAKAFSSRPTSSSQQRPRSSESSSAASTRQQDTSLLKPVVIAVPVAQPMQSTAVDPRPSTPSPSVIAHATSETIAPAPVTPAPTTRPQTEEGFEFVAPMPSGPIGRQKPDTDGSKQERKIAALLKKQASAAKIAAAQEEADAVRKIKRFIDKEKYDDLEGYLKSKSGPLQRKLALESIKLLSGAQSDYRFEWLSGYIQELLAAAPEDTALTDQEKYLCHTFLERPLLDLVPGKDHLTKEATGQHALQDQSTPTEEKILVIKKPDGSLACINSKDLPEFISKSKEEATRQHALQDQSASTESAAACTSFQDALKEMKRVLNSCSSETAKEEAVEKLLATTSDLQDLLQVCEDLELEDHVECILRIIYQKANTLAHTSRTEVAQLCQTLKTIFEERIETLRAQNDSSQSDRILNLQKAFAYIVGINVMLTFSQSADPLTPVVEIEQENKSAAPIAELFDALDKTKKASQEATIIKHLEKLLPLITEPEDIFDFSEAMQPYSHHSSMGLFVETFPKALEEHPTNLRILWKICTSRKFSALTLKSSTNFTKVIKTFYEEISDYVELIIQRPELFNIFLMNTQDAAKAVLARSRTRDELISVLQPGELMPKTPVLYIVTLNAFISYEPHQINLTADEFRSLLKEQLPHIEHFMAEADRDVNNKAFIPYLQDLKKEINALLRTAVPAHRAARASRSDVPVEKHDASAAAAPTDFDKQISEAAVRHSIAQSEEEKKAAVDKIVSLAENIIFEHEPKIFMKALKIRGFLIHHEVMAGILRSKKIELTVRKEFMKEYGYYFPR